MLANAEVVVDCREGEFKKKMRKLVKTKNNNKKMLRVAAGKVKCFQMAGRLF